MRAALRDPSSDGQHVPRRAPNRQLGFTTLCMLVVSASCSPIDIVEDSAAACSNRHDDDGDDQVDCDDPGCVRSGVCEVTLEACTNEVDDNANGYTDCQEPACVDQGFCVAFASECQLLGQSGCPTGMGCYPSDLTSTECRLAGLGGHGMPCKTPAPGDAGSHPCQAGHVCLAGLCSALCEDGFDCFRGSKCESTDSFQGVAGFCTVPCSPSGLACAKGECLSYHQLGQRYDDAGFLWLCGLADTAVYPGTADTGAECDDPATNLSPLERVCRSDLACVPEADGRNYCRTLCAQALDGSVLTACEPGFVCALFYPLDPRPLGPPNLQLVFGACVEE